MFSQVSTAAEEIDMSVKTKVFKYKNGSARAIAKYVNGKRHGVETWYYKSGEIKTTVEYVDGIKQGLKIKYKKDGTISSQRTYLDDKIVIKKNEYRDLRDKICTNQYIKQESCQKTLDMIFGNNKNSPIAIKALRLIKGLSR